MPLQQEDYLTTILGTPSYYRLFYDYARSRHAEENLDFLQAVRGYQRHAKKKKAIGIIDRFVNKGGFQSHHFQDGQTPVNLDVEQAADLRAKRDELIEQRQTAKRMGFFKRHWTSGHRKAAETLFNDADTFIFNLVLRSTYTDYAKTEQGKAIERAIDKRVNKNGQVMMAMQVCFEPGND